MAGKPWYQQFAIALAKALSGFLLFGATLDSVTNATDLISDHLTYFGTVGLLVMAGVGHFALRRWPLRWIAHGGAVVRLSGLGRASLLGLAGALVLLWIPRLAAVLHTEDLTVQSERVNADYPTEFRHAVSVSRTMPSPAFVLALWDVIVINNSQRNVSLVDYQVVPLDDLPARGPYGEPYDQGLVDARTNEPLRLPLNLAAGHAVRFRVRSFLVIPTDVTQSVMPDVPWNTTLEKLFFDHFYSQGIDCFGNKVTPGPGGYGFVEEDKAPRDQRLQFTIRTGRGTKLVNFLTWYSGSVHSLAWPRE